MRTVANAVELGLSEQTKSLQIVEWCLIALFSIHVGRSAVRIIRSRRRRKGRLGVVRVVATTWDGCDESCCVIAACC